MKFWIREANLKAGGKEFTLDDFDMKFRVPFSTKSEPDISEITLYNLTQNTISGIEAKAYIILNAGYRGDVGNILSGKLESISSEWQGVDKVTTLTVSDGGFEWRNTYVQKAYQAGSTAKYIMQDLAGMLGLEVAEIEPKKDITYQLGKSISGKVEEALKRLVKDTESKMYISKGRVYIRDRNKGTVTGFLLDSDHGLIGSPEKVEEEDDKGKKVIKYKVKSLLNYKLGVDSLIQIKSKTINGNFRVESGEHLGGNEGDYYTDMLVVPIK